MSKTIPPARTFISFDWAMKRLFKQKSNHDILEGFLSELFRFDVRVTVILDSESIAEKKNDKTNRVDLLCKNEQDELIIIEMQYFRETDYFQRMLFGASKLVLEYLDKKLPYGKIKKIYSVHIVYFNLGQGKDYVYRGRQQFTGIHQNDTLKLGRAQRRRFGGTVPADLYPEYYIINISRFVGPIKDTLDEWIYYFKHSILPKSYQAKGLGEVDKQLKLDPMNPELHKEYVHKLKKYGISEKTLLDYWDDGEAEGEHRGFLNGLIKGKEEGIAEGIAKGKAEGKAEGIAEGMEVGRETGARKQLEATVLRMHRLGMSLEGISEIMGIEVAEVEAILNNAGKAAD